MRILVLVGICLLCVGCLQPATAPQAANTSPDLSTASSANTVESEETSNSQKILEKSETPRAIPSDALSVKLIAGAPDAPLAPRYSPGGKGLALTPFEAPENLGVDGLSAEVALGPKEKPTTIQLLITRAAADAAYTKLYVDVDGNGKFDEPAISATSSDSRGMVWSNFNATLKVSYSGAKTISEDYPVTLWLAVAKASDKPDVLRISRRGYKAGELKVGEQTVFIVLSDSNNDAVFGEGDWWELRADAGPAKSMDMRRVGDFAWLGDSAYKLELEDPRGSTVRLVPFDPGKTREEDALARDPNGADKKAVKADKPLEFRHDVDEAIAEAADKKLPCFIKFETTWCGPCQTMTQLVFTSKDVVDASEGVVCVKIDGDERKDWVERFKVNAYPTGVMLAADGSETARFVGYQKVVEMAAFLKEKRTKQ